MALVESSKSRQVEGSPYYLFLRQGEISGWNSHWSHTAEYQIQSRASLHLLYHIISDFSVRSVHFHVLSGTFVLVWLFRVMGVESWPSHTRPWRGSVD
jgi:hypothetical protein